MPLSKPNPKTNNPTPDNLNTLQEAINAAENKRSKLVKDLAHQLVELNDRELLAKDVLAEVRRITEASQKETGTLDNLVKVLDDYDPVLAVFGDAYSFLALAENSFSGTANEPFLRLKQGD